MEKLTKLVSYRVNECYFKINEKLKAGDKIQIAPKFECKIKTDAENIIAEFIVKINEDIAMSIVPFDLKLSFVARFLKGENTENDNKAQLKYVVTTVFPFVRGFIGQLTLNANVPPCILPPIDIEKMCEGMQVENGFGNGFPTSNIDHNLN